MLTYDENEMPKIVPFDFITPNYLQNVVVCVVMVYMLLYMVKTTKGCCMSASVGACRRAGGQAFVRACVRVCIWYVYYIDTHTHIIFFLFFSSC